MSERKLLRYSYPFQVVITATGKFTRTIHVPFTPDEVKVKQLGFYLTGATAGVFTLQCDPLIGQSNTNLGFFIDPIVSFTGLTYPLGRPITGSFDFTIMEDAMPTTALDNGSLSVHLEFRKYI